MSSLLRMNEFVSPCWPECVNGIGSEESLRLLVSFGKVVIPTRRDSEYVCAIAREFCGIKWCRAHDRTFVPLSNCEDHDWHIFSRIFFCPFGVPDLQHWPMQNTR